MKFCIALHFQNEADWLRLHLTEMMKADGIDGLIAIDGGSQDGSADVIRNLGGLVYNFPFRHENNGIHQNEMLEKVEAVGYDAVLHIDPDECLFPAHITQIKCLLEKYKALRMPTFNFVKDRFHYAPCQPYYPDWHVRAWRLNEGVRYPIHLHSQADVSQWDYRGDSVLTDEFREVIDAPHIHLFHYGDIKDRWRRDLLALNRQRAYQQLPLLDALPDGYVMSTYPFHIPFVGQQPLDPNVVGVRAPISIKDIL